MANCAIVGVNWGDEGKGRMVDLIARDYDVVVRYQGGNNAGHTVINEFGKFALLGNGAVLQHDDAVTTLAGGAGLDQQRHRQNHVG